MAFFPLNSAIFQFIPFSFFFKKYNFFFVYGAIFRHTTYHWKYNSTEAKVVYHPLSKQTWTHFQTGIFESLQWNTSPFQTDSENKTPFVNTSLPMHIYWVPPPPQPPSPPRFYGRPFQEYFSYIEPFIHQRWAKSENPGENHLTICKQNLAFPRDPSKARTTAVRNLMDWASIPLSTRLQVVRVFSDI